MSSIVDVVPCNPSSGVDAFVVTGEFAFDVASDVDTTGGNNKSENSLPESLRSWFGSSKPANKLLCVVVAIGDVELQATVCALDSLSFRAVWSPAGEIKVD